MGPLNKQVSPSTLLLGVVVGRWQQWRSLPRSPGSQVSPLGATLARSLFISSISRLALNAGVGLHW